MDTREFLAEIQNLYGNFVTEGMMKAVAARISPLDNRQRDKLFEVYIRRIPGTYRPDLKNVLNCMEAANIKVERKRICSSCGYKWSCTSWECPRCGYSADCGDPVEYHRQYLNGELFVVPEQLTKRFSGFRVKVM